LRIVIDGNNWAQRAFGQAPLFYRGQRTEVIAISLNMLRKYLKMFDPVSCYIVWDAGRDERRTSIYPEYKRRKKELTEIEKKEREAFYEQANKMLRVLKEFGFIQYKCKGREADDIIATLVLNKPVDLVISNDWDFCQLFSLVKGIKLYFPIRDIIETKESWEQYWGFSVNYYTLYRALTGDSSDNIPGLKGIARVKAQRLIKFWDGQELEEKYRKWAEKFTIEIDEELIQKWKNLIEFKDIEESELEEGRIDIENLSTAQREERVIGILKEFGLEKALYEFRSFIAPFRMFWMNRKDE